MDEGILESKQVVIIDLVKLRVELLEVRIALSRKGVNDEAYQIENRYFHHALVEVRCPVLDNLDGDNLLRLQVLAFDHLPERALTEDVKDEVTVPGRLSQQQSYGSASCISRTCGQPPQSLICR